MPGKHLSDTEKKLLRLWNHPPQGLTKPSLRSIEISGGSGLRGIDGLKITFHYPITAICGNNGSGKSTVLALSALAFHSPVGWLVYWGNTEPSESGGERSYYKFSSFFLNGQGEVPPHDVAVTWRYEKQGTESFKTFVKSGNQWGRYNTRPEREVHYLPIGRILPANELTGVRSTFRSPGIAIESTPLSAEYTSYLAFIMGKQYSQAEMQKSSRYKFQCCTSSIAYTAFNMGSGESCMIILLHLLQELPMGGMLVVEEIEAGLHPQAQIRLAEKLLEICQRKKIQVICSTHSQVFIDSLPREARLLIKLSGQDRQVVESPSTRLAMYEMTGEIHPELIVYCEDEVSSMMIEESLSHDERVRLKIQTIGSGTAIMHQGVSHLRSGFEMRSLCILDGDCKARDIKSWVESERGSRTDIKPEYILLPGDELPPEKWAISQLQHSPYKENFARLLNCSIVQAQEHIQALSIEMDHHKIPFVLHQRTGLEVQDCARRIMRSFALQHPQLDDLRGKVKTLLD